MSGHARAKALGYGTHDGRYLKGSAEGACVDIMNQNGEPVTQTAHYQIRPAPELTMDLDNVFTREDQQMQTVGHHWPWMVPGPKKWGRTWYASGFALRVINRRYQEKKNDPAAFLQYG